MRIGIPKEIKPKEGRVGLIPHAVADLVHHGHEVFIQKGAGALSGFRDEDYVKAGASLCADAIETYSKGQLIVKVKEPVEGDLALLEKDHLLFCYLHLAPNKKLTDALLGIGLLGLVSQRNRKE